MGIDRTYLSAIENGRRSGFPTLLTAKASALYGISCSYLLGMNPTSASEIHYHMFVEGLVSDESLQIHFDKAVESARRVGFDAEDFCKTLGLPFGPERLPLLDPDVKTPLPE